MPFIIAAAGDEDRNGIDRKLKPEHHSLARLVGPSVNINLKSRTADKWRERSAIWWVGRNSFHPLRDESARELVVAI